MTASDHLSADIAVIGADAGGLTLALACRRYGLSCHLYMEPPDPAASAADPSESGSLDPIIELTANATRVLQALGLRDTLAAQSSEPLYSLTRTGRGGLLLNQRPLGPFSTARYGASAHLLAQSELLAMLYRACEQAGVVMHRLTQPIAAMDDQAGTLTLADGVRLQHGIIAVAVPRQADRTTTSRAGTAPQAEFTVLRADSSQPGNPQAVQIWTSAGLCCVEYPRGSASQLLVLIPATGNDPDPQVLLTQRLERLHPHLRGFGSGLQRVTRMQSVEAEPLEEWYRARRVLLGDACHPLPAHATQATAAAVEDAWVLATMLERWEASPAEGLADYQRFRRPRVLKIREHACAQARVLTLAAPRDVWRRNFIWGMTSRFLPEHSMSQDDWLFGYDCIKGFV